MLNIRDSTVSYLGVICWCWKNILNIQSLKLDIKFYVIFLQRLHSRIDISEAAEDARIILRLIDDSTIYPSDTFPTAHAFDAIE